jgi:prevent-host-death family protein
VGAASIFRLDVGEEGDHNDHMEERDSLHRTVGSRELKTRLGTYLRQVKEGATLIVTERGRPIAELRPVTMGRGLDERLYQLATEGLVRCEMREPRGLPAFQPITLTAAAPAVSAALIEERADRF